MSLQLLSTVLQFLAGFVLSVEAIGVERVRKWIALLSFLNSSFARPNKTTSPPSLRDYMLNPASIVMLISIALGTFVGQYFGLHPPVWGSMLPKKLFLFLSLLVGSVTSMMISLAFIHFIIVSLKFLEFVDSHIRANSAGVVGFVLLTLGYGVQFVVILFQEASK